MNCPWVSGLGHESFKLLLDIDELRCSLIVSCFWLALNRVLSAYVIPALFAMAIAVYLRPPLSFK